MGAIKYSPAAPIIVRVNHGERSSGHAPSLPGPHKLQRSHGPAVLAVLLGPDGQPGPRVCTWGHGKDPHFHLRDPPPGLMGEGRMGSSTPRAEGDGIGEMGNARAAPAQGSCVHGGDKAAIRVVGSAGSWQCVGASCPLLLSIPRRQPHPTPMSPLHAYSEPHPLGRGLTKRSQHSPMGQPLSAPCHTHCAISMGLKPLFPSHPTVRLPRYQLLCCPVPIFPFTTDLMS